MSHSGQGEGNNISRSNAHEHIIEDYALGGANAKLVAYAELQLAERGVHLAFDVTRHHDTSQDIL